MKILAVIITYPTLLFLDIVIWALGKKGWRVLRKESREHIRNILS